MFLRALNRLQDSDEGQEGGGVSPTQDEGKDSGVEFAKAFAKRLAQSKEEIRKEERAKLAKEGGYATYEELLAHTKEVKLAKASGLDPDSEEFKRVVNALSSSDGSTDDSDMRRQLEELKLQEQFRWETSQLDGLKTQYGLAIKSLDDLDEDVKSKIKQGIDPVDAYYLVHKKEIISKSNDKGKATGKEHLTPDSTDGSHPDSTSDLTPARLAYFRELVDPSGELSDEELIKEIKALGK